MKYVNKIPSTLTTWLVILTQLTRYIKKFFFGPTLGVLISVIILYFFLWIFGDNKPLTFNQLITWIFDLDKNYKVAALSSTLTVIGFLIAFHAASHNWIKQTQLQLNLSAAQEIESFFVEIFSLVNYLQIFTDFIVSTVENKKIDGENDFMTISFNIQFINDKMPEFIEKRQRLSNLTIDVNRLVSNYAFQLLSTPSGNRLLKEAIALLMEISTQMWIIDPYTNLNDQDIISRFITSIDVNKYKNFVSFCAKNSPLISIKAGMVKGQLAKEIFPINIFTLINLIVERKLLKNNFEVSRTNQGKTNDTPSTRI